MPTEDDDVRVVYANSVELSAGPFDIVFDFGFRGPVPGSSKPGRPQSVAKVAMSLSHAKTMLPILARVIADYEKNVGTIPAPGFEDNSEN